MNPLEPQRRFEDVQNRADDRGVAIDEVGIDDLRYPVTGQPTATAVRQRTVATVAMDVDLPAHLKGTHMSRFVEALRRPRDDCLRPAHAQSRSSSSSVSDSTVGRARTFCSSFRTSSSARAPVSGLPVAQRTTRRRLQRRVARDAIALEVGVRVPVTSLCPCSKEISDYGAHNQRGYVDARRSSADAEQPVWLEDLIEIAEAAGSAPIYPLLKRPTSAT